jgi:hypothetical protein
VVEARAPDASAIDHCGFILWRNPSRPHVGRRAYFGITRLKCVMRLPASA